MFLSANKSCLCLQCSKNIFLFINISIYKLSLTINCSDKQFRYCNDLNSTNKCLVLNPSESLTNLFNQLNDFSLEQKQYSDNIQNLKYYNLVEIQSLNKLNYKHSQSLLSHHCMFPYKKHRRPWTSPWFHSDWLWCYSYNWHKSFKK